MTIRKHKGSSGMESPHMRNDGAVSQHRKSFGNRNSSRASALVLNVCPLSFPNADVVVDFIPYEDRDQLRELRHTQGHTHVFRRRKRPAERRSTSNGLEINNDGTEIVAVPFVVDAPTVGNQSGTVALHDNLWMASALVQNAVVNHIHALPRKLIEYSPITFIANENLLAQALPSDMSCPEWLSVCPLIEVAVRVFNFDRRAPFVGACLNVFTKRQINRTCSELLSDGFPLIGHYVKRRLPQGDRRIAPAFALVGRVARIEESTVHLADHRDSEDSINANDAFVEGKAFESVLRHVCGDVSDQILLKLGSLTEELRQGEARLKRLREAVAYFQKTSLEILPGVQLQFEDFLSQSKTASFPTVEKAPAVVYVFDATGKTDTWHDRGLDRYGPYSRPTFTPTEPKICVVCQKPHRGRIEQFIRKFLDGIEDTTQSNKRQPFTKGCIRKYALKNAAVEFFETEGNTAVAYRKAVLTAIEAQTERKVRFDLALVEIEERFHALSGSDNPYLVSKAEFMAQQLPVQEFEFETTALPESRLQYALNNMALATYSKLGGIPWLVKANMPIAQELVIGLGSARIGQGRLGESERIVGITTVFTGEGNYCVSTVSKAVAFDNYEEELLTSLRAAVERVSKDRNWRPNDHVRLVFHAFKPFKSSEEDAVKRLMQSFGTYHVDFAFLNVVEDHPFQLFDENQGGVPAFDGTGGQKGRYAPERARYIRLSGHEALITLTGPTDLKKSSDGLPRPVLLRLGWGSTFNDMAYLTEQVNTFANHSWRSFFPSPLPVTVMYSELIARVLGNLATIPHWNPAHMLGSIREKCWFL
jgi:hypothetical protein